MSFIKNIEAEKAANLAELIEVRSGEVVSRTLAQNKSVSLTLFAFDKNEGISTHESKGDAFVQVLSGCGQFTVAGQEYECKLGDCLVMPANKPHSVYAKESFKMLLTVIFQ